MGKLYNEAMVILPMKQRKIFQDLIFLHIFLFCIRFPYCYSESIILLQVFRLCYRFFDFAFYFLLNTNNSLLCLTLSNNTKNN